MQQGYKRALGYALEEKRLWVAGLLAALAFSEAWRIIFDWGPQSLGERWEKAVAGWLGETAALAAFVLAALAAFAVIKAVGYMGEMVLVRQVADGEDRGVPAFDEAFSSSRSRYVPFAITLLPWDALRLALVYLPSLIIIAWGRWDPDFSHIFLYMAVIFLWFILLVVGHFFAGITTALAARSTLLMGGDISTSWSRGWQLLRENAGVCLAVWLQILAADILFVIIAWPFSALLPWLAGSIAGTIGFAPARWSIHILAWVLLAGGLIALQTAVQCFRSSLWTMTFLALSGVKEQRGRSGLRGDEEGGDGVFCPRPASPYGPPQDFMP